MTLKLDGSKEEFDALAALLKDVPELNKISEQLRTAVAFEEHMQEDEIPKEGDNPFILRPE